MLQMCLFSAHSEIEYLGKCANNQCRKRMRGCRDETVYTIINELFWAGRKSPDIDRCHALFRESIAPRLNTGKKLLCSWEGFIGFPLNVRQASIKNFCTVFGRTKILVTIRNPASLIESAYFNYIRRLWIGGLSRRGNKPVLPTSKDWLEKIVLPDQNNCFLYYADAIQSYVELVGRENVGVFMYEALGENQYQYIGALCRFIGVGEAEGIRIAGHAHKHKRFTMGNMAKIQEIEGSFLRSLHYRYSSNHHRAKMIGYMEDDPALDTPPARMKISTDNRERIAAITRHGNHWLMNTFALPLERFGYPL